MRWLIFLSVFSAIYGGLHIYALWRAAQAGFHGVPFYAGAIIFMLLMMSLPFLLRTIEGSGHEEVAKIGRAHV